MGTIIVLFVLTKMILIICILFLTFYGLDVETFVADILRGENLSKKAKEKRESLIKKIKDVKST